MWEWRRKWALNIEYAAGRQGSTWSRRTNSINRNTRRKILRNQPLVVLNVFNTILQTAIARFLSTRPVIHISSGSHDQTAIDSARVAQRVIGEYEWNRQKVDELLARSLPVLYTTGSCIWKVEWDPESGQKLADASGMQGQEFLGEQGAQAEDLFEGNVRTTMVDPIDFLVDPGATTEDDAMWMMHTTLRTPAWIFNKYGVRVSPGGTGGPLQQSVHWSQTIEKRVEATASVDELWIRPGRYPTGPNEEDVLDFPNGYVITVCNGRVLDHGPMPYKDLPFIFFPAIRVPREFWGDTIMNSVRSPQASLNKTVSQIVQANDLMGNPQWLCPNGSNVPEADKDSKAAIWIRYDPVLSGVKPEPVQPPTLSIGVFRHVEFLLTILQQISGQHEGGMAGGNGQAESGVQAEQVIERDTTRLQGTASEIGRAIEKWANKTADLVQEFWAVPRVVTVTGSYMESETLEFAGADIGETFDIRVVPESVIPQSKAARFQKAFTLFQAGLLSARDARKRMGEESHEELTLEQLQINRARDENRQARDGGAIQTLQEQMSLEDHVLHMEEHLRALFDPNVQQASPAWIALYQHILFHNNVLNMQFAPPPPQPGEPGGPPEEDDSTSESSDTGTSAGKSDGGTE